MVYGTCPCVQPLGRYRPLSCKRSPGPTFLAIFTFCLTCWRWSAASTLLSTELIQALVKRYRLVHDTSRCVEPFGCYRANTAQNPRFLKFDAASVRVCPRNLTIGTTKRCPDQTLSNGVPHAEIGQRVQNPGRIKKCPFWAMTGRPTSSCHRALKLWQLVAPTKWWRSVFESLKSVNPFKSYRCSKKSDRQNTPFHKVSSTLNNESLSSHSGSPEIALKVLRKKH